LADTRRAISRARPDEQGFAAAQGRGIVPLKVAPASIERGLQVLSRLLELAETHGYRSQVTDSGLILAVDDESIDFRLEERLKRTPYEPTATEVKHRDKDLRWGFSSTPWPKYDYAPSGRLAIVIQTNSYSGLRRTFADGKTQTLEDLLPALMTTLAEHAALIKEYRRANEERERQWRESEARRVRNEAFKAREKRRMAFINAIHEQLTQRAKLSAVLAHLESAPGDDADRVEAMLAWVRRRLRQIDALISPLFLDISARSAKLVFEEPTSDPKAQDAQGYFCFSPSVELQFWSMDEEKGLATSRTEVEWVIETGLVPNFTQLRACPAKNNPRNE
jgi:hypothetical protein